MENSDQINIWKKQVIQNIPTENYGKNAKTKRPHMYTKSKHNKVCSSVAYSVSIYGWVIEKHVNDLKVKCVSGGYKTRN